jgi:hypothetical protein
VLDTGRREVEEAQLARALLRRMADDLRSTVRFEKIDLQSMLSQARSNTGGGSGGSGGVGGSGNSSGSPGGSNTGNTASNQSSSTGGAAGGSSSDTQAGSSEDIAASGAVPVEPGLYGNLYELQLDVSRLPRIDQYDRLIAADGRPADMVSDVKTVAYYLADGANGITGLVRREMDRAATTFAYNNGGLDELSLYEEPLAPEVVALEFRYFDGTALIEEWDTSLAKNLPVAVEIFLVLAGQDADYSMAASLDAYNLSLQPGFSGYRLLVHLPGAKSLADQEADAALEAAAAASGTGTGTPGTQGTQGTSP